MRLNWIASSERAAEDWRQGTPCEFICYSRDCLSVLRPSGTGAARTGGPHSRSSRKPALQCESRANPWWKGKRIAQAEASFACGTRTDMY